MSKTKQPKLPDKPSQLIRVALKDLTACERSRKYKISMAWYHEPNGKCKVCLAGAVMAKTLKIPPTESVWPSDLADENKTAEKLRCLDGLRIGEIQYALEEIGERRPIGLPERVRIIDYGPSRKTAFKRDMRKLARTLQEHGL